MQMYIAFASLVGYRNAVMIWLACAPHLLSLSVSSVASMCSNFDTSGRGLFRLTMGVSDAYLSRDRFEGPSPASSSDCDGRRDVSLSWAESMTSRYAGTQLMQSA
jgi:hypothetical protein